MIVSREIRNERESATEIDVDGAWCNEYETATAISVDHPLCNHYEINCSELSAFSHLNKQ